MCRLLNFQTLIPCHTNRKFPLFLNRPVYAYHSLRFSSIYCMFVSNIQCMCVSFGLLRCIRWPIYFYGNKWQTMTSILMWKKINLMDVIKCDTSFSMSFSVCKRESLSCSLLFTNDKLLHMWLSGFECYIFNVKYPHAEPDQLLQWIAWTAFLF